MTYATIRISSRSRQLRRGERQLPERHYGPPTACAERERLARGGDGVHPEKPRAPLPGEGAGSAVAGRAPGAGSPVPAPRNRLRDGPTSTGRPSAWSASSRSNSKIFCSAVFEKPKPGSSAVAPGATPAAAAAASAALSSITTSPTTSA